MTSFKRTQRKYVQKAYRVRNWREYETGLRARGSLTVWLGLTDGKLANWNSPRPTRRKPGRQRKYSNHAIETTVTLGLVFGLASRQTEGFLRSLLTLLNLDNDVPDHSTISRRKARLGKVASYERRTVKPVHLLIDSSGLSVHVGQLRTPPKARDYRKLHLAVDEHTSDVVACELTSKRARDASRVASLVGQIERPIASAKADAAYDTGDVYKTLENHRAHRSPKVLIPPRTGAQLALDSAGTRQRNRNIRARSRVGKRKWYVASGYSRRSKVETTFHRYKANPGLSDASEGTGVPESRGEVGVQDSEHHDGARDTRWRDDRMTGRRSHGRLSALNGVVHQGTCGVVAEAVPWCDVTTARFTTRFEEAVGFLVQRCDKTSVQEMFNVAWVTVGQIVERVRHRHRPDDPLEGLMAIGVDELSYRKGHKYVTTVTDQLSGQIVWAAEGKNAATLQSFFDALGPERCAAIAVVTMDMSEAYITVVQQTVSQAQIVFGRHLLRSDHHRLLRTRAFVEWDAVTCAC